MVLTRLEKEVNPGLYGYFKSKKLIINRTDIPKRTDIEEKIKSNNLEIKATLYGEQGGVCNGCKQHFRKENLEIDHKMPKSKGGSDDITNLQLLCGYCNRVKGDRPMEYLIKTLTETLEDSKYCSF